MRRTFFDMKGVMGPVAFLVLGLVALAVCLWLGLSAAELLMNGTAASATITDIEVETNTQGTGTSRRSTQSYTTHLAVEGVDCRVGGRYGEVGAVVAVRYDPEDASSCVVDSMSSLYGFLAGGLMGALFAVIGAVMLVSARRKAP